MYYVCCKTRMQRRFVQKTCRGRVSYSKFPFLQLGDLTVASINERAMSLAKAFAEDFKWQGCLTLLSPGLFKLPSTFNHVRLKARRRSCVRYLELGLIARPRIPRIRCRNNRGVKIERPLAPDHKSKTVLSEFCLHLLKSK